MLYSNRDTTFYVDKPKYSIRKMISGEIRHFLYISSIKFEKKPFNNFLSVIRLQFNYSLTNMVANDLLKAGHFDRSVRCANGTESETVYSILEEANAIMLSENHPVVNKILPGFELNDKPSALTLSFNGGTTLNYHLALKEKSQTSTNSDGLSIGNFFSAFPGFNIGTELKLTPNIGLGYSYNYSYLKASKTFLLIHTGSNPYPAKDENLTIAANEFYVIYRCALQKESSFWLVLRPSFVFSTYKASGDISDYGNNSYEMELKKSTGFGFHCGLEYKFINSNSGMYFLIGTLIRSTENNSFADEKFFYYFDKYTKYRDDTIDMKLGFFIDIPFYQYKN